VNFEGVAGNGRWSGTGGLPSPSSSSQVLGEAEFAEAVVSALSRCRRAAPEAGSPEEMDDGLEMKTIENSDAESPLGH
jgi:hypothetical protein